MSGVTTTKSCIQSGALSRTKSVIVLDKLKRDAQAPSATAGELSAAPTVMSETELARQCVALVNQLVVFEARTKTDTDAPYLLYAGMLVEFEDSYAINFSSAFNYLEGISTWSGEEKKSAFPPPMMAVQRLVSASVFQTERAKDLLGRKDAQLRAQREKVSELENNVKGLQEMVQQLLNKPDEEMLNHRSSSQPRYQHQVLNSTVSSQNQPRYHHQNQNQEFDYTQIGREATDAYSITEKCFRDAVAQRGPLEVARDFEIVMVAGYEQRYGGNDLRKSFVAFRRWLASACSVQDWNTNPELVALGDHLLKELKLKHTAVRRGVGQYTLQQQMMAQSEDPYEKAAIAIERRNATSRKGKGRKGGFKGGYKGQGNGQTGRQ